MNASRIAACVFCLLAPTVLAQGKVLQGKEISESALVDALTPEPRSRSIRVTREAPPPAPAASLLITFETNSAELTPEARQSLDVVGQALRSDKLSSLTFTIEGHADPRGTEAGNLKLSQARAESVVGYLVKTRGIDRARLKPVGKGQAELMNTENPIAPENRRVTIKTVTE
jgi:outer membrane protein OmpA-like peptidoglycan-associated protein